MIIITYASYVRDCSAAQPVPCRRFLVIAQHFQDDTSWIPLVPSVLRGNNGTTASTTSAPPRARVPRRLVGTVGTV